MKGMISTERHLLRVRNKSLKRSAGVDGNSEEGKYQRDGVAVAAGSEIDER